MHKLKTKKMEGLGHTHELEQGPRCLLIDQRQDGEDCCRCCEERLDALLLAFLLLIQLSQYHVYRRVCRFQRVLPFGLPGAPVPW